MVTAFLKLLNLSISASWLVLVVLVLRFVWKRSPKWVNVLLWGIVALRLLLPFSIESALSLIPSAETISPEVVQFDPAPTITSGVNIIDNAVNPSLSESFAAAPETSVNPLYVWTEIAGCVWLIGLAAMLLYALVSYLRLRRRVSVSLHVRGNIYLCDAISSPFILGVVKPRIYLPSTLDEVQQRNVLAHEHAHLTRHDHWWKPLGFALLAVYWFNPVLWLAYALLCRDIELACDERVIRDMDETAIKTYSTVLLACSVPRKAVAACPLAFGEVGVKGRVRNALHYKKPAFWIVATSVIVCIVVAVCFLTNPPQSFSKVCGDFWDAETTCTYVEEQLDADARYTTADGTVRLSEHLAGVRIGAARPEKTSAVNPEWSTLYLALPGVDGADAKHLTIDFIREYDAPGDTESVYSLNIGTRDAVRSYKVLSGQDEIDAFLTYLRSDIEAANAGDIPSNRVYVDDWSICIVGQWLRNAGTRKWWSDSSDAYLNVVKQASLADELTGLQNASHAVEELDGYYRCVTQEGLSNTIVYLYPVLSNESCYWVETHWSYDNADVSELELQAKQLRMMAESFRVENESSDSTVPPTDPEEGWIMPLVFIDSGNINNKTGLDTSKKLNKDNGKYVNLYVENKGSGSVIATINGQSKRTLEPGKSEHIYVEVTQGALGADRSYKFKVVPGANGGTVDIYYEITQRDSVTGYPTAYDELLTNICNLRSAGAHDIETEFSSDLLVVNDYYQSPGWLLRDLDGDGTGELLLGADWGGGHTVILNIYRLDGAKAIRVVDGWSRSRWYLCTDGSLAHESSDGASEGTFSYYRYENGALRHLETLISLDGWYYSDTTDHYLGGDGFRAISEDDAATVMNKYTYEALSFTPFAA